jgi:DNA polymerase-4
MESDSNIKTTNSPRLWRMEGGEVRTILHMDMDCFFVSVSRLINPKLVGKPVIVGGGDRGVVAACSYETRKFGVHSAMPIKQALRLCPDAIIVRGDYDEYSKRSDEITQIIKEEVPVYERSSIDEFYMDLTGMDKFFGCYRYATELRQKIMKETGLPISFGMSANKTVSKVATDEAKPNNQMKVDFGYEKDFLAPLSVKKIPMIGEKTYHLLRTMGIELVKTLQEMPIELLQNVLGENGGSIWRKANGIDTNPVEPYTEQKSMSQEETFVTDTIDIEKLKNILIAMTEKLCFRLRTQNKLTGCISVKIRYSNFDTHNMQCRIPYSSSDHTIIARVKELFTKLYNRRMLIRLVGVKFSHLVGGGHQVNLFDDNVQVLNLYQTMDRMRILYGAKAVQRAIGVSASLRSFNPFNGISHSPEKERKADYEYLIVVNPPSSIRKEIVAEKKYFAQQYKFPRAEKLKPHLELARFYLDEKMEELLITQLDELSAHQPTFEVTLNNYGFFPEHSLYIDVKNPHAIIDFVKVLKRKLELAPSASVFLFQPLVLIAEQLTHEVFLEVQKDYEKRKFKQSFILQKISLLRRQDELDVPLEIKEFEFYSGTSTEILGG